MLALPCSSNFFIQGIEFSSASLKTTALRTCKHTSSYRSNTDEFDIGNVKYSNFEGKYVNLLSVNMGRSIIYDDGSFTGSQAPATVVRNLNHLAGEQDCPNPSSRWPSALVCNENVAVRAIRFQPSGMSSTWSSSFRVNSISDFEDDSNANIQTFHYYYLVTLSVPFITGRYYKFSWGSSTNNDFGRLYITPSERMGPGDEPIIFKHEYINSRELFEVKTKQDGAYSNPQTNRQITSDFTLEDCNFGDFYHDNDNRTFGVCINPENATYDMVDVDAIYCRDFCPEPNGENGGGCAVTLESSRRLWSDASNWPDGKLPAEGDNVTIPAEWQLILDVDPPRLDRLLISGSVVVSEDIGDISIEANNIWVQGKLKAGTSSSPFPHKLTIKMYGDQSHRGMVIDPFETGNKLIAVTGTLALYGQSPGTVWTRLQVGAFKNSQQMTVDNAIGWKEGDELVIGPSFSDPAQTEYVKITSVASNTITFSPPLKYDHYGAHSQTVGEIDSRTAVGHLTRNIKITTGDDEEWGYRILTYGYMECNNEKYGLLILSGVEMEKGGQYDSLNIPAVHMKFLFGGNVRSEIRQSSLHHCRSRCILIDQSSNIKINNNVLASATNNHIELLSKDNLLITITFNLMIDAHAGPSTPPSHKVSCFSWR